MPAAIKRPCAEPGCSALVRRGYCSRHEPGGRLARPEGLRRFKGRLILVCGPPASGKTTYCKERAQPDDEILDLDEIQTELSGYPIHCAPGYWLEAALKERNKRLHHLAENASGTVYFIIGAPSASERRWWTERLGAHQVVVLEASKPTCVERWRSDSARDKSTKNFRHIIDRWWRDYGRNEGDTVICS